MTKMLFVQLVKTKFLLIKMYCIYTLAFLGFYRFFVGCMKLEIILNSFEKILEKKIFN